MKLRAISLIVSLLTLSSVVSAAQNNCSGTPAYGTCPAPAPAPQVWCAGNNSASTCSGGTSWVGFYNTTPASGSWSGQFEGLDAATIRNVGISNAPGAQADPNGGIGPTNAEGVGQYLEFSDNFIQAFDRSTGNGIFSNKANGTAEPQSIVTLFRPSGSVYCSNPSLDGIASYDRIDGVFVIANFFKTSAGYFFCIGASAPVGAVPANNLQGAGGKSNWNAYAYSMNPTIPTNAGGTTYFPDYVRFGNWSDGFYISFDLEDPGHSFDIVGFEVCQLDKADIVAGLSSNSPVCYTYIPSYVVGASGTDKTLIHSILPADFEGENAVPSDTLGEYFLALVNPSNSGTNVSCSKAPCITNGLAFWTWSGFTSGAGPTYVVLKDHGFTPGCYAPASPYNTYCVPEPYGGVIDSLGDRLNYRLAYRYSPASQPGGEVLAVAQTVQESSKTRRTGVRYFQFLAGATPTLLLIGDINDTTNYFFNSFPSVAMDDAGDLGITYTATGNINHGSVTNYDPSPFFVTVDPSGNLGTPVAILANSGSTGQDETDEYWGEYVSVGSDPDNDSTFWAIDEYMNGNQVQNCSYKLGIGTGCSWATRVFTCQKGNGC